MCLKQPPHYKHLLNQAGFDIEYLRMIGIRALKAASDAATKAA